MKEEDSEDKKKKKRALKGKKLATKEAESESDKRIRQRGQQ